MKYTRLHLQTWRNFVSAELAIGERVFLVEPNACGKSNLLDAFRFLRDLAKNGGALQQAINKEERGMVTPQSGATPLHSDRRTRAIGEPC